jgi:hypothetical protein
VKAQHEARALALVSLSGTLAAALLAIAAFAGGKSGGPALPLGSRLAAVAAVLGFLGAVYFALEILRPARHRRARSDEIRQIIDKEMRGLEADVLWRISMLRVDLLESYRVQNLRKAREFTVLSGARSWLCRAPGGGRDHRSPPRSHGLGSPALRPGITVPWDARAPTIQASEGGRSGGRVDARGVRLLVIRSVASGAGGGVPSVA